MLPINRILVPTDFSPVAANAYAYAIRLADILGAEIQLVHCVYPPLAMAEVPGYQLQAAGELLETAESNIKNFAAEGLTMVAQQINRVPVIKTSIELGGAVPVVQNKAEEGHFELVIMGTRGATTFWEQLFGTNTAGMLQNAPCPVLVIPEGAIFKPYTQLLLATDLRGDDVWVGKEVIDLLAPMNPDLHLIHVSEDKHKDNVYDFDLVVDLYQRNKVPFRVDCTEIERGDVKNSILELAHEIKADLIIMSRPHYNLFDQLFHKSYTREVVLETKIPLLVLNQ